MQEADRIRDKLYTVSQKMRGSGTTFVDARDLLTAINYGMELYSLINKLETQMNVFVEKTHAESAHTKRPTPRSPKSPRGSSKIDKQNVVHDSDGHTEAEGEND